MCCNDLEWLGGSSGNFLYYADFGYIEERDERSELFRNMIKVTWLIIATCKQRSLLVNAVICIKTIIRETSLTNKYKHSTRKNYDKLCQLTYLKKKLER